jgi:hypothetical protein
MTVLYFLFLPFGQTLAYNILIWLSFPLTGLATYLLLNLYFKNPRPAIIGALVAAAIPFRQTQLVSGHLNGLIYFLLPLAVYFYELAFEKKQLLWAFFSALAALSLALSAEVHLFLYLVIFSIFHLVFKFYYFWRRHPDKTEIKKWLATTGVVFLGIVLALGYTLIMKRMVVESSSLASGRSLKEVRIYSAFVTSFFNRRLASAEIYTYLGLFSLLSSVFAFVDLKKKNFKWLLVLVPVVLLAFVFVAAGQIESLLAIKHRLRNFVAWSVLPAVLAVFVWIFWKILTNRLEDKKLFYLFFLLLGIIWSLGTRFPLYTWAFENLPYLKFFRSPARAMALAILGLSTLAAAGYLNFENIFRRRSAKIVFFVVFLFFIFLDFRVAGQVTLNYLDKKDPVYNRLKEAANPADKILELPVLTGTLHQNSLYQYYVILHGKQIINGYHPYPSSEYNRVYLALRNLNYGGPTASNRQLLGKLGVRYLVLHERFFSEIPVEYLVFDEGLRKKSGQTLFNMAISGMCSSPYLKKMAQNSGIYLFKLKENNR